MFELGLQHPGLIGAGGDEGVGGGKGGGGIDLGGFLHLAFLLIILSALTQSYLPEQ